MANFNTNQNRQFYVVDGYVTLAKGEKIEDKVTAEMQHPVAVKKVDGKCSPDKELYFVLKGAETPLRSDLIQLKNLTYVKATSADAQAVKLKSIKVSLSHDVNDAHVVVGQDYILRIVLRNWIGLGDDNVYIKEGAVHGLSSMVKDETGADATKKFYEAMVKSLELAFSREIGAHKETDKNGKTKWVNPYLEFEAVADGIIITEKEQEWSLGLRQQERVNFDVVPTTIYVDGEDQLWAKREDNSIADNTKDANKSFGNGHMIADLEYFCMGERGDQYRNVGWPNVIPTKYLVDPSKTYNTLDIHYAFTDDGTESYRSEKEITIVAEDAEVINKIVGEINKITGNTFDTIKTTEP